LALKTRQFAVEDGLIQPGKAKDLAAGSLKEKSWVGLRKARRIIDIQSS
jgi:hypothetical protein